MDGVLAECLKAWQEFGKVWALQTDYEEGGSKGQRVVLTPLPRMGIRRFERSLLLVVGQFVQSGQKAEVHVLTHKLTGERFWSVVVADGPNPRWCMDYTQVAWDFTQEVTGRLDDDGNEYPPGTFDWLSQ